MVEIVTTDEFREWYEELADPDGEAVYEAVEVLRQVGVGLGHPRSSAIKGSRHALRELRVQSGGDPLRILYAFDPERNAVLLIGADKAGDKRFYEWIVPKAEILWEEYLAEMQPRSRGRKP